MIDSTAKTFLAQLTDERTGDYAEINLGTGREWLTSRLFIMAIVFARMKGIECFVFVETSGAVRKRFVGWAEPAKIRGAVAQRYLWLERAYADAYATVTSQRNAVVVSRHGRLGYPHAPGDPGAGIELRRSVVIELDDAACWHPGLVHVRLPWISSSTATACRDQT